MLTTAKLRAVAARGSYFENSRRVAVGPAALRWRDGEPEGGEFVCLDARLREAARKEGFRLLHAQF